MALATKTNPTESLSKVDVHLKALASAAEALNAVSDELTRQVTAIETGVNALNLGIKADVIAHKSSNVEGTISHYVRLRYGKAGKKWGFVIDEYDDYEELPEWENFESWPFKEAPRGSRLKAVEKIPELIEELVKQSEKAAEILSHRCEYAKELASRVVSSGSRGKK